MVAASVKRVLILLVTSALAGIVAAVVAAFIARLTGGSFTPSGGALIGLAFGVTAVNIGRSAGARSSVADAALCGAVAAGAAWVVVRALVS
jgi:hypothetical protein